MVSLTKLFPTKNINHEISLLKWITPIPTYWSKFSCKVIHSNTKWGKITHLCILMCNFHHNKHCHSVSCSITKNLILFCNIALLLIFIFWFLHAPIVMVCCIYIYTYAFPTRILCFAYISDLDNIWFLLIISAKEPNIKNHIFRYY